MVSLIGAAPFRIGTAPVLASVGAAAAVLALCAWGFPVVSAQPPAERPVLITMLDHDPTPMPEPPPRVMGSSGEARPSASRAEVPAPPPTAVDIAAIEHPALTLPFAQGEPSTVLRPAWGELPLAPDQPILPESAASGDAGDDARAFWTNVRGLVAACAVYPAAAARRGNAGEVVIHVRIRTDGALDGALVAESSSDPALDRAAVAAVREAAPFPIDALGTMPGTNVLEALIPLRFELVAPRGVTISKEEGQAVQNRRT